MTPQQELEELLRKKGIGPEGSKSLKADELIKLTDLIRSGETSLTTKATILVAFLILEPTPDERDWLDKIKNSYRDLEKELHLFFEPNHHPYSEILHKIINKQSLTEAEALRGMELLFDNDIEDCYKAAFLEGERLKRESFEENKTFLNFLYEKIDRRIIELPVLIDICDNYDGSNRTRNFSLFTATLLGAAGFPTIVHGVDVVAPKMGYTPHKILKAAEKNPLIGIDEAINNLISPETGWTYLDQEVYFPELFQLKLLRKEMVKRPFLATFEKLLQPIQSKNGNLIVTGFTHAHYKSEIALQLQQQGACQKAMVLKGAEGSSHMSMTKDTICVLYDGETITDKTLNPSQFSLSPLEARIDRTLDEKQCLEEGVQALNGEKNYARENILYLGVSILANFSLMEPSQALSLLIHTLDSGKALKAWNRAHN